MLENKFFDRDAMDVAKKLIGKVIRRVYDKTVLSAMIVETECYYLNDKGSHASLGFTEKRRALFMPAGTIYMYYARGKDSLNVSCNGDGNAVLIKACVPFRDSKSGSESIEAMHRLNPLPDGRRKPEHRLCSGQTLLCKALDIKLPAWDQRNFNSSLYFEDINYRPDKLIQTTRLGIPKGRDEHLPYRFADYAHASSCTSNPLTKREPNYNIINGCPDD